MKHILAIDQGTTSSRAFLFDQSCRPVYQVQQEFTQHFPESGWVEHQPEDLWNSVISTCKQVIECSGVNTRSIVAAGITNQRETTLVWHKSTAEPLHRAIVWQDRRTSRLCDSLRGQGIEAMISERTGLLLDPYFSATKVKWILDRYDPDRKMANKGELLFGTVDSYLLWRLTNGQKHVTDATNAARTMLYNIRSGQWDEDICKLLDIPVSMLPQVLDCAADFGTADERHFGLSLPICGVAGDQQAASLGQSCLPGMVKSTYGTGCFALLNTGEQLIESNNRLLGTIASRLQGKVEYALEGSIFTAGAAVQWLRDGIRLIESAQQSEQFAKRAQQEKQRLYLVPAFTGLGAPYWDPDARGALFGLTRDSGPEAVVRAALESVAYQTVDLIRAMNDDWQSDQVSGLRVDGGMTANNWLMQFLADMLDIQIDRPQVLETTVLGAAWLAGMQVGLYPDRQEFARSWRLDRSFQPAIDEQQRSQLYAGWKDAVARTLVTKTN